MMILQKCNNIKIKTAEQGFRSFTFKPGESRNQMNFIFYRCKMK